MAIGKIFLPQFCAKIKEKSPAKKSAAFGFEMQIKNPARKNFSKISEFFGARIFWQKFFWRRKKKFSAEKN